MPLMLTDKVGWMSLTAVVALLSAVTDWPVSSVADASTRTSLFSSPSCSA
jgi:hypothetical protein